MRVLLSSSLYPAEKILNSQYYNSRGDVCYDIKKLSDDIRAFLAGEPIEFSLDKVCLDICSPFQRRVLEAEYRIPRGYISTYGRLAKYLGKPGGFRAVGNALARNPFPIIIPCHRTVLSDFSPGGFQFGSEFKHNLLELEGHCFDENFKLIEPSIFY
ncbi:MGMT family protein [bacterium]|nr:MGMT family protein [bacterium]